RRNPGVSLADAEGALLEVPGTATPRETGAATRTDAALLPAEQEALESPVAKVAEEPTVGALAWEQSVAEVNKRYGTRGESDPRFALSYSEGLGASDRLKELYSIMRHGGSELTPDAFAEHYGPTAIRKLRGGY